MGDYHKPSRLSCGAKGILYLYQCLFMVLFPQRNEIDCLTSQLKDCQEECRNIEGMRQTTLDCLRALEHELVDLQDTDQHLLEAKRKIQEIRTQVNTFSCVL